MCCFPLFSIFISSKPGNGTRQLNELIKGFVRQNSSLKVAEYVCHVGHGVPSAAQPLPAETAINPPIAQPGSPVRQPTQISRRCRLGFLTYFLPAGRRFPGFREGMENSIKKMQKDERDEKNPFSAVTRLAGFS